MSTIDYLHTIPGARFVEPTWAEGKPGQIWEFRSVARAKRVLADLERRGDQAAAYSWNPSVEPDGRPGPAKIRVTFAT